MEGLHSPYIKYVEIAGQLSHPPIQQNLFEYGMP